LPLTFTVGRFLGNQLYGTSSFNPIVLIAAALALVTSAVVASCVPALRASRMSPVEALRAE
jgi:ABC-type antimicrobial peptide transport system permease subunit